MLDIEVIQQGKQVTSANCETDAYSGSQLFLISDQMFMSSYGGGYSS